MNTHIKKGYVLRKTQADEKAETIICLISPITNVYNI